METPIFICIHDNQDKLVTEKLVSSLNNSKIHFIIGSLPCAAHHKKRTPNHIDKSPERDYLALVEARRNEPSEDVFRGEKTVVFTFEDGRLLLNHKGPVNRYMKNHYGPARKTGKGGRVKNW